ncbi:MAG: zinc-ribbon domain-containing protein [Candidatus Fimenecus sp.]
MIVLGIILIFCGGFATIWASDMKDSFEYNWYSMWGSSDYAYVDIIYNIGIIAAIAGVLLLVLGCVKKTNANGQSNAPVFPDTYRPPVLQNTILCPYCNANMSSDAKFCPQCGNKINPDVSPQRFCEKCGEKIGTDDVFCTQCGNKQQNL